MAEALDSTLPPASRPVEGASRADLVDFELVVRRHQRRLYRLLLSMLRDADAAETLTQECFLSAYRNRNGFRGEAGVGTWLVRIAVNLAHDHARSRRQSFWRRLMNAGLSGADQTAAEKVADNRASAERALLAREELAAVWKAAEELSPQQRAIFHLRFGEEMPLEQIARVMELEVGTVKAHLSRALGAVRKRVRSSTTKVVTL